MPFKEQCSFVISHTVDKTTESELSGLCFASKTSAAMLNCIANGAERFGFTSYLGRNQLNLQNKKTTCRISHLELATMAEVLLRNFRCVFSIVLVGSRGNALGKYLADERFLPVPSFPAVGRNVFIGTRMPPCTAIIRAWVSGRRVAWRRGTTSNNGPVRLQSVARICAQLVFTHNHPRTSSHIAGQVTHDQKAVAAWFPDDSADHAVTSRVLREWMVKWGTRTSRGF